MVLGKRARSTTMSTKRRYTGASSYQRYTPYAGTSRKGFYGRRYTKKGYNQQLREVKYVTAHTEALIDENGWQSGGAPSGLCINGTDVGADVKQRIGRRITMKTAQIRMTISSQNDGINEKYGGVLRVILYYDRNSNGAVSPASIPEVLDQTMMTITPTGVRNWINCGKNLANKDRFLFLLDKTYTIEQFYELRALVPPPILADEAHVTCRAMQKNFYIPLKNLNTSYNGTGNTLGNINEGSLILMLIWNKSAAGLDDSIHAQVATRVRYVDM